MNHSGIAIIDPYKVFKAVGLSAGMRAADFGCGRTGHFVFPAVKTVGDKGIVYAVDVIKSVLENIRSVATSGGYDCVQTVWSDIEKVGKTPIPDRSLDVCFFVNILFQVKDKESVIKEAARLLKQAGRLAVIDWSNKLGALGPSTAAQVMPAQVIGWAQNCDLRLKERLSVSDYHYLLVFEKI